ncbi:MAG: autotransporter domain-containing protein, partial [Gammaproteobacteria bacterium]|nr:autotransporter domain-containing protein [Gammaproteobacteria bacterium]
HYQAFRWEADVMVGLGFLNTGGTFFYSEAHGVNADGTVVVGWSSSAGGDEAFRWTKTTGMVGLGFLTSGYRSEATGVNADGNVVVGVSSDSNSHYQAFRWTETGGMVDLGHLAGGTTDESQAHGVSADGKVVVGFSEMPNGYEAFRWTEADGMISIAQWLTDNGVTVAITPRFASAVNADGSVVVGIMMADPTSAFGEAFLARVSDTGSGLITLTDVGDSLSSTAEVVGTTLRTASTLVNGAHSRPMSRRVAVGQKTAWLAGDWGHDNHNSRDGSVGLAEVGVGHNFGLSQINVSLGKTWADQDLIHSGDIDADGKYVMVEGIFPVSEEKGVYATLGAYYHWGDNDIRRGYLNAGLADTSSASPDTQTWGLRARIDWENAFSAASTQFSPYANLTYTDISMDSYTESGGGFPAHFDSKSEDTTEVRAGLNAAMPIPGSAVQFVSNIEVTHRFDDEGARTSGQLPGLFAFDLDGQDYDSTWLKGGVGIEGQLGEGKVSLMLNGTTRGEMASAWLAASYQVTF